MINYKDIECIHRQGFVYVDANNLELVESRTLNTTLPLSKYGTTKSNGYLISLFHETGEYICSLVRLEPYRMDNRTDTPLFVMVRNGKSVENCHSRFYSKSDSTTFTSSELNTYLGTESENLKCYVYKSSNEVRQLREDRRVNRRASPFFEATEYVGLERILLESQRDKKQDYNKVLWRRRLIRCISRYSTDITRLVDEIKTIDNDRLVGDILEIQQKYNSLLRSIKRSMHTFYLTVNYGRYNEADVIYKHERFVITKTYNNVTTTNDMKALEFQIKNTKLAVQKYKELYKVN